MPSYRVGVVVEHGCEYDEAPTVLPSTAMWAMPHDDWTAERAIAATLRDLASEFDPQTTLEADGDRIWDALNAALGRVHEDFPASERPATRRALFAVLYEFADRLGIPDVRPGLRAELDRESASA